MYSWNIDFILKSGRELTVYYKGTENNSMDVASKVLIGGENTISGFSNKDGTKNIFVKIDEIVAMSISAA